MSTSRKITIVGGGQSGLQLGCGLLSKGYEVDIVQNRTAEQVREGKVLSSQCMFDEALQNERDLGLNFWDGECPTVDSINFCVPAPDGSGNKAIDWNGKIWMTDRSAPGMNQSGINAPVAKLEIRLYIIRKPVISSVQKLTSPITMLSSTATIQARARLTA